MQPKQIHKNPLQKEENLITTLIAKYVAYWPLFLVAGILAFGCAYVYLRYTIPLYEATATLIIKDEKKGYDDSKMMESLNMMSTKKIIENEVEVLHKLGNRKQALQAAVHETAVQFVLYALHREDSDWRFRFFYCWATAIKCHHHSPNFLSNFIEVLLWKNISSDFSIVE